MPITVARAIVRAGSRTSPAGTVADSMPMKANIVSGASAAAAVINGSPLGLNPLKREPST